MAYLRTGSRERAQQVLAGVTKTNPNLPEVQSALKLMKETAETEY
jgi:hypothetical protein